MDFSFAGGTLIWESGDSLHENSGAVPAAVSPQIVFENTFATVPVKIGMGRPRKRTSQKTCQILLTMLSGIKANGQPFVDFIFFRFMTMLERTRFVVFSDALLLMNLLQLKLKKKMQKQAVIVVGHGSKSLQAVDDFNFIVELLKEKLTGMDVYPAHMELAAPSLEDVVDTIARTEVKKVLVLPYFLFNGNHIKYDIPKILALIKEKYSQLNFEFGKPIGREPLMAEIMYRKVLEITL